jgi:APA family basic amino acid/polyamine antiporter
MNKIPMPTPHEGPTTGEAAPDFQRQLGLFDSTMLVAGTMIGSGIFITSASMARDVGSPGWLLAAWILTGVMTIFGALSYAELAAMMPHAGGQYVYLREAYSPMWGFLYGWTCFLVIQTASIAAVGVAFAKFLGVLAPGWGTDADAVIFERAIDLKLFLPLPWSEEALMIFEKSTFTITRGQLVAAGVVIFLTLLNCRGVREGKIVQNSFTIAKTLGLILLIVVGLTVAANSAAITANTTDVWEGIETTDQYESVSELVGAKGFLVMLMVMGGAMVGSLFSADAWNNITFTAGEVKDPHRNLGRSLILGTTLVIVLYLLANLAYLMSLPLNPSPDADAEAELARFEERIDAAALAGNEEEADAIRQERDQAATISRGIAGAKDDRVATAVLELASPLGVTFMAALIMISTFGCINGMTLMGARLYYAMAKDQVFFQAVGKLNRRGVPAAGLILQGVWSVLLIFSGSYNELLDYVIFAALLFYALTIGGLFMLRRKMPFAERPYQVIGYPVLPALYIVMCVLVMIDLLIVKPIYTWPGLIIVLSGMPVYYVWRLLSRRGA